MNDQDLVRLYALGANRGSASRAGCPAPEALLAAVERTGPEEERMRAINHAMTCADCGEELELLRASRVVRDRPRASRIGFALAASALVAIGLGYYAMRGGQLSAGADDLMRGDTDVQLTTPATDATEPLRSLTWRAVPGAAGYIVEIRRDDGTLVLRSASGDTVFAVPESIAAQTTGDVYWGVTAALSDGTERRSSTRRLRTPAR
jgi:hypothetical protein